MRNIKINGAKFFLFSSIIYVLASCGSSDPNKVVGLYKVLTLRYDSATTIALVKQFGEHSSGSGEVVPPNVFAIGHDDDFIIVKQHPTNGYEGGYKPDTSITNYYIVDMNFKV